jgi:hypothetical protein
MRRVVVSAVLAMAHPAVADEGKHLLYAEALGKGGLYGLGYEYSLTRRLALGGAASFAVIRDQQVLTVAPYLHATLLSGSRHALFTEVGAILAHSRLPSPVTGWDGMTDTGGGGFASLGWERATRHFAIRASASLVVGEGGLGPMIGISIGARP